jgi:hypothetical protein|tara:strand:+ start:251 stop:1063 length:813 start_codon:yes stop_codon:yes gene_type:complete
MQLNLDCEKYDKYHVKRVKIPMVFSAFNAKFNTSLPTDLGVDKESALRQRYKAKMKLYGRRNANKVRLMSFLVGAEEQAAGKVGASALNACDCDSACDCGDISALHSSGSSQSVQSESAVSSVDSLFSNVSTSHAKVDAPAMRIVQAMPRASEEFKAVKPFISDPLSFKGVMRIWLDSKTSAQRKERAFMRRDPPMSAVCTDMEAINAFVDSISFPVKKYEDKVIRFYNGAERRASSLKVRVKNETMPLNSEKALSYIKERFLENKLVWV